MSKSKEEEGEGDDTGENEVQRKLRTIYDQVIQDKGLQRVVTESIDSKTFKWK